MAGQGRQERNLQVFIFTTQPALSDPLGARAPCRAEGEPCLPRHQAIKQHLFNKEEMVPKGKKHFASGAVRGPLCLTYFLIDWDWLFNRVLGKGSRARGRGLRNMMAYD